MSSILWLCLLMTCFISTSASSTRKDNTKTDLKSRTKGSCGVVINEGDIIEVRRLLTMEHVNMIDLQLLSGPNFGKRLFPHLQITFASANGRQILSLLDIKYLIITSTLAAGRRRFALRIRESRAGCIRTTENKTDFVSGNLLKQLIGSTHRTYCEVCYAEAKVSQLHSTRRCCNITENDYSKYQCYEDQYQNKWLNLVFLPNIPIYIIGMAFIFILIFGLRVLVKNPHEMDNRYYYLTENTTSIRCFIRFVINDDHGRPISIVRRLFFVVLICFLYTSHLKGIQTYLDYGIVYYWAIFFPFSKMFDKVIICKDDQRQPKLQEKLCSCISNIMTLHLKYDLQDLSSKNSAEIDILQLISLPFNTKRWKVAIKKVHKLILQNTSILRWETKNSFYNSFQENVFCLVVIAFFLVYIPVVLVMMILLITITKCFSLYRVVIHSGLKKQYPGSLSDLLFYIHEVLILILTIIFTGLILLFTLIPFSLGLLMNILYFIPHITVVSVSTFYFLQFWKSMDNEYFALKMFIYEECKGRMCQNNDDSDKDNQSVIVPVVSKQLYHKIREKLLPYHTILWIHGLKLFGCVGFLWFFIYVIMEQQKYNATPIVKVLTTMSISVLPYIFNTITLKLSEEEKRAGDERLKLKIKHVLHKLIAEDPGLSNIDFTIQLHNNERTAQRPDIEESAEHDELVSTEPKDNTQWETSM